MCEKVKKKRENPEKLADLVCTNRFHLYKRLSKAAKQKKVSYSTSCIFLFTVWNCLKTGQMQSDVTK